MTMRNEIIAALDTIGALGNRNYTDQAPDATVYPYTVLHLDIGETPDLRGDGRTIAVTRLHQVDLLQARSAEDEDLRIAVWNALDGLELSDTYHLAVRSSLRIPDANFDLVRRALTIAAVQKLVRT